ncbi:extensin family protein [Thalassovita sp.]|uniref:extensin-like domain-containing protein n=1 Tax=Thalassovita sp. TaxID=1979401 RepID=UPI0029DE75A3|nr:extensin family protein [Thalassovita sp.]
MKAAALVLIGVVLAAAGASADAPSTSLRPVARGEVHAGLVKVAEPRKLPAGGAINRSLRPVPRPGKASRAHLGSTVLPVAVTKGAICGDPGIAGHRVGAVTGKIKGCGLQDAVRVTAVSGVALSRGALMDCHTAKALKSWVDNGVKPAIGDQGGGLAKLQVFASYSCRTRNSQKGAKISEHGKGRAVDVGAFILRDGSKIVVQDDWGRGRAGRILKKIHGSACGPFGTVLGPKSDKYHQDHFHVDTARYRGGAYCK